MRGRQERRRKQLLVDIKESSGCWNLKRKHWLSLCGEFALEGAMDLS